MRSLFSFLKILIVVFYITPSNCSVETQSNCSLKIVTIHGSTHVTEPVLVKLIQSAAFQRLKSIRQYGIFDYIQPPRIPYSRFEHSLGVFFLLRENGASLVEQIAGLLHDISHTVFSHSLDPLFMGGFIQGAYQDVIQEKFLKQYGIEDILREFGYSVEQVCLKGNVFKGLDQELPYMCADRIEYNLFAGHMDGQITPEEHIAILRDLKFDGTNWFFTKIPLAKKFAEISLWQTLNCWGSIPSILGGQWIAPVFIKALQLKLVDQEDIHFRLGDDHMWQRLHDSKDADIQAGLEKIKNVKKLYVEKDDGPIHLLTKFRGVNPLVKTPDGLKHLTELDSDFSKKYEQAQNKVKQGWRVTLT